MPRRVDYSDVLKAAEAVGLRCVYPNGAAFGPATGAWSVAGWIIGDDTTLRPQFRQRSHQVDLGTIAPLVCRAWRETFTAAEAWIAPVHHWAAELDHGTDEAGDDVSPLLSELGIDPAALRSHSKADAITFSANEADTFEHFVAALLPRLWKTDFTLLLPGDGVVGTVHHHRQLWWRCAEAATADTLLGMASQA